jgi:hypothetical protein
MRCTYVEKTKWVSARGLNFVLVLAVFFLAQSCQVKLRGGGATNTSSNVGTSGLSLTPDPNGELGGAMGQNTANFNLNSASAGHSFLHITAHSNSYILVGGISVAH